ncbi:hypothetical protein [Paenibacillus polymyxa]|uniref:hypothetical protein n=1 Tax=Paenibacillus polymyxa TaxID=1406 RepID=UPI002025897C|nr:hypothetical protein [Paenibacillus polymyxa]URJ62613.1 hypothetical protein MF622_002490 [Paenibacillus polymyxa]
MHIIVIRDKVSLIQKFVNAYIKDKFLTASREQKQYHEEMKEKRKSSKRKSDNKYYVEKIIPFSVLKYKPLKYVPSNALTSKSMDDIIIKGKNHWFIALCEWAFFIVYFVSAYNDYFP